MTEYDLSRFVEAQKFAFEFALSEIKNGRKRSHWMWYIFPQLRSLGRSPMAVKYGICDLGEAKAYMENPYLRENLITITKALLALEGSDPTAVMGSPDDLKLCSCMTLFEIAAPDTPEFSMTLEKYYNGKRDPLTIELLKA